MDAHLLDTGWDHHDIESERVAAELEASAAGVITDDQLDSFLHLALHTIGEHLGDWSRARRRAEELTEGREATADTARVWSRLAVVRLMAGDPARALGA